jgi:hypothetical protein
MPAKPQTFDEWWNETYADSNASGIDYTFGEEVWNAAQRAVTGSSPVEIGLSGMSLEETEQIVRAVEARKEHA